MRALEIREGHRSSGFRLGGWEVPDNGGRADIPDALTASWEPSKTLHTGGTVSQYEVMREELPSPKPKDESRDSGWWVVTVSILGATRWTGGPPTRGSGEMAQKIKYSPSKAA